MNQRNHFGISKRLSSTLHIDDIDNYLQNIHRKRRLPLHDNDAAKNLLRQTKKPFHTNELKIYAQNTVTIQRFSDSVNHLIVDDVYRFHS